MFYICSQWDCSTQSLVQVEPKPNQSNGSKRRKRMSPAKVLAHQIAVKVIGEMSLSAFTDKQIIKLMDAAIELFEEEPTRTASVICTSNLLPMAQMSNDQLDGTINTVMTSIRLMFSFFSVILFISGSLFTCCNYETQNINLNYGFYKKSPAGQQWTATCTAHLDDSGSFDHLHHRDNTDYSSGVFIDAVPITSTANGKAFDNTKRHLSEKLRKFSDDLWWLEMEFAQRN